MEHDKAKVLLQDYLDGDLDGAELDALRGHLAHCPDCASELARLEALLDEARALPEGIEPGRDLWEAVARRIGRGDADQPAESRHFGRAFFLALRRRPLAAAAAAAAIVLALLSLNRILDDPARLRGPGTLDRLADGTVSALEAEVAAADPGVETLLASGALGDTGASGPILENLGIVNTAIDEARRAWKANPENSHLARMLISAYQAKLALQEQVGRIADRT